MQSQNGNGLKVVELKDANFDFHLPWANGVAVLCDGMVAQIAKRVPRLGVPGLLRRGWQEEAPGDEYRLETGNSGGILCLYRHECGRWSVELVPQRRKPAS